MALEPGRTLAHYTLRDKIGEGGMGAVFRAADTKLGRDVAIKALPDEVAADPDRLARFRREAQILASLNHPNIAAIYGLEEAEGTLFLVLELVEGEDLAERLARGPIPVEEAVGIALQIAEGLEEAHEHGIIHRDLKPANVKLTGAGKVKILDFGLGKAIEGGPEGAGDPSMSPTLTAAATRAGIIMGTAAYMSPEQARGGSVDKRADIWAFGCVLLEMLSGSRIFAGDTISDTLAAVLKTDPDWSSLPDDVGPRLRRLLARCLDKKPRTRLRDIGEARIALEGIRSGTDAEAAETVGDLAPAPPRGRIPILAATVILTAAGTASAFWLLGPRTPEPRIEKLEITGPGILLDETHRPALSRDGRRIVFASAEGLWVRDLGDLEPRLLAGTTEAAHPVWSPDGTAIAYYLDGTVWRIPAQGGQPASIAVGVGIMEDSGGLSWAVDDEIVYAGGNGAIFAVPSRGGEPRVIAEPDEVTVQDLHQPHALPEGRGVLYAAHRLGHTYDTLEVVADGESKVLLQIADQELRSPIYASTGHILFRRRTGNLGLWAVPFSLDRLELTGEPFLVTREGSLPAAAPDGSLLYSPTASDPLRQLVWYDRQGDEVGTVGPPARHLMSPALSPDGHRVAVMSGEADGREIWVYDLERGTRLRLTFSTQVDWDPAWTPDGRDVVFWEGTTTSISVKPADGTGEVERLVMEDFHDSGVPTVAPDGSKLLFWVRNSDTGGDIYTMPMEGEGTPEPLVRGPFDEEDPALSADGRYVAYISDESGRQDVYLTRFPSGEGKWQVSVNDGTNPRWDPVARRLYYLEDRDLMEVEVEVGEGAAPTLGNPRRLFTLPWLDSGNWWVNRFTVARDGERFLFAKDLREEAGNPRMVLVRNWILEFEKEP